jgi:hypothetical protein
MLHDQIINFLETAVIFLLLTNAVSIVAAAYAISLVQKARAPAVAVARRPNGIMGLGSGH